MKRLLDLLALRSRKVPVAFDAPLLPDAPLAVIGDVHGRDDLLERLLDRLAQEAPGRRIVLVGDLIDRGENSAGVLRRLMARPDIVCLRGNHEAMALSFLDDPEGKGRSWLHNGGLQTLASFGVGGLGAQPGSEARRAARDRFALALGDGMAGWLRSLPLVHRSGNVVVTHAGADPLVPLEAQAEESLLWGHPRFGRMPRADGLWIAHGHVIQPEPLARAGRIAVDTGAYATGRLTAAIIDGGEVRFVSTGRA